MDCSHHTRKATWNKVSKKMEHFCMDCGEAVVKRKSRIWAGDKNVDATTEFNFECENLDCSLKEFLFDFEDAPDTIPEAMECPDCGTISEYFPVIQAYGTVQGEGSGGIYNEEDRKTQEKKWLEAEVENTRTVVDSGGTGASPYNKYTMNHETLAKAGRLKRVSTKEASERQKASKKLTTLHSHKISDSDKRFTGQRHDG
jgi:hypothetical protein